MRPLIIACALIVLAALAVPDILQRRLGPPRPEAAAEASAAGKPPSIRLARTVEVEAARDGHFYIEAEVNRQEVRFMVDTGATAVALRQTDAEAAGIRVHRLDFNRPVRTANGTTYAAPVELDSIAVADLEVSSVPALVLPDEQLGISLLGGSFLNRLRRFEVADGVLVLEN